MKKLLVISSAESINNKNNVHLFTSQIQEGLKGRADVEGVHYWDIAFLFSKDIIKAWNATNEKDLASYDFVFFKSYDRYSEIAVSLAEYLNFKKVPFFSTELKNYISISKLSQYARMAVNDLPIPKTYYQHKLSSSLSYDQIKTNLGLPFIAKAIDAKGGNLNFLVNSTQELLEIHKRHPHTDFLFQEFIPNDYDLRIILTSGIAKVFIKRARLSENSHLNNTSKGAKATLLPLGEIDDKIIEMATKAADLFRREVCGVDILIRKSDSAPFVLEVNVSPQVATGVYVDQKINAYIKMFKGQLKID